MNKKKTIRIIAILIGVGLLFFLYMKPKLHSQKPYDAKELGIKVITAENDEDQDGIDDYTDICNGAKAYIATKPKYKSKYYAGGYPDDGYGVCTDVVWNAFKGAGFDLKALVDTDIAENLSAYNTISKPDPNIDFRRVKNLKIFFDRNAKVLTKDFSNPEEWQAGDIVVFTKHIAICSDKRNKKGIPFIIHHASYGVREANDIENFTVVGHYRWEK